MTPDIEAIVEEAAIQVLNNPSEGLDVICKLPIDAMEQFRKAIWEDPVWFARVVVDRMKLLESSR